MVKFARTIFFELEEGTEQDHEGLVESVKEVVEMARSDYEKAVGCEVKVTITDLQGTMG